MSIFCWVQARDSEDKLFGSFANGGAVLFLFDLQLFVMEATPWSFAFQLEAPNSWDVQEGKTAPVSPTPAAMKTRQSHLSSFLSFLCPQLVWSWDAGGQSHLRQEVRKWRWLRLLSRFFRLRSLCLFNRSPSAGEDNILGEIDLWWGLDRGQWHQWAWQESWRQSKLNQYCSNYYFFCFVCFCHSWAKNDDIRYGPGYNVNWVPVLSWPWTTKYAINT